MYVVGTSEDISFLAYGGQRFGANSKQDTILALDESSPKSVFSQYQTQVQFRTKAVLAVNYTLNISHGCVCMSVSLALYLSVPVPLPMPLSVSLSVSLPVSVSMS